MASQSLDTIEEILLFLKENPTGQADIGALFRAMHTFKGNSASWVSRIIESRAHLAEDLIGLVRDDGVALCPEMVELLLETADVLRVMLEGTLVSRRDADEAASSDLAARMRATFDRCKAAEAEEYREPEPEPEAESQAKPAPEPEPAPAPEPEPEPEAEAVEAAPPRAPEAIVFEPVRKSSLAEDAMYRDIFSFMAQNALLRDATGHGGASVRPALGAERASEGGRAVALRRRSDRHGGMARCAGRLLGAECAVDRAGSSPRSSGSRRCFSATLEPRNPRRRKESRPRC